MLPVKTGLIQLKDSFFYLFIFFFLRNSQYSRIIVGLIHVPAYAKLVILETETLANVCKGDRAAFVVIFKF